MSEIAKYARWVKKFWRFFFAMAVTSALVAGVEATTWPSPAKTGLMMAISMTGGSGMLFSLIDYTEERRAVAEAERKTEAANREREAAEWKTEALAREREALARENAELRRRITELEQRNNGQGNPQAG